MIQVGLLTCQIHKTPLVICPDCFAAGTEHFFCPRCVEDQELEDEGTDHY